MSDRQNTGIPFPDELEHLSYIRGILEEAMEKAEADVDRKDREYMKQKRYMVEYRGEIDPHEMFQNELALRSFCHRHPGQACQAERVPVFRTH